MRLNICIFLFSILFGFSNFIYPQDYTKMMEIQAKIQKLAMQLGSTTDMNQAQQIQSQIETLTKEMMLEGQKIEHEGMGQGEAPTELLSQEEFAKKALEDLDAKIKSLPPALQEIYYLERKLDDLVPEKDADEINDISDQIMDKMGLIYSGKIPLKTEATSFISAIKFVKEGTINCEIEGSALEPDLYDMNYKMVVNMDIVWVADYTVDIIQKKGYLIGYSIDTYASESEPEDVQLPSLSGTKLIIKMGTSGTKGPIDKYKLDPGYGYFQIAPTGLKFIDIMNPPAWPDEMVNKYTLSLIPPQVLFYSSMDDVEMSPWIPFPAGKLSVDITPAEINEGIQKGEYNKTITLSDPPGPALTTTLKVHLLFEPLICDEKGNPGAMAVSGACIDHGGYIMAKEDHVYIDGKPVARVGDKVLCFRHGTSEIVGDANIEVYSNKERVARVGDKTKCGAVIQGGIVNIYAGDKKK